MKKYRAYTAKKFKVWKKIIFFAAVALIIFGLTVALGNHLKNKLESADTKEPIDFDTTEPVKDKNEEEKVESVPHDEALAQVKAGCLDLFGITDTAAALAAVEELKAQGYNAVSFVVTDADGKLTYQSPAVAKESRLPVSESLVPYEILKMASSKAKDIGMGVTGVMTASESLSDELVAQELSALGFDTIVVRGFEEHTQLSNEIVDNITAYADRLRSAGDGNIAISICFAQEIYKSPTNAPYIEKVYEVSEFLSIDMTEACAEDAAALADELAGSFSAYLLRPVLSGDNSEAAASVSTALDEASIVARQYISSPENPAESTNAED